MNTKQLPDDFPAIQGAIYAVALSLDAFLINGILYGVFLRSLLLGFLEKTADDLLRELTRVEEQARQTPAANPTKVAETLRVLRFSCQQLIDHVKSLSSYRTLSLEQVRSRVSQIPLFREACVRQIQDLEACFQTPKPFYSFRPADSTARVNGFLADLDRVFTQEWNAAPSV